MAYNTPRLTLIGRASGVVLGSKNSAPIPDPMATPQPSRDGSNLETEW